MASFGQQKNEILEIVAGLFNGAPGGAILDELAAEVAKGAPIHEIARLLAETNQFKELTADKTTTVQQVEFLLNNFGLAPGGEPGSAAALAEEYFTQRIEEGASLGHIVYEAIHYLRNDPLPVFADTIQLLDNKVQIASVHAENYREITSVSEGISVLNNVLSDKIYTLQEIITSLISKLGGGIGDDDDDGEGDGDGNGGGPPVRTFTVTENTTDPDEVVVSFKNAGSTISTAASATKLAFTSNSTTKTTSADAAKIAEIQVGSGKTLSGRADVLSDIEITGAGNTMITSADGNQTLTVKTTGTNTITGGKGADVITLGSGADTVVIKGGTSLASTSPVLVQEFGDADLSLGGAITFKATGTDSRSLEFTNAFELIQELRDLNNGSLDLQAILDAIAKVEVHPADGTLTIIGMADAGLSIDGTITFAPEDLLKGLELFSQASFESLNLDPGQIAELVGKLKAVELDSDIAFVKTDTHNITFNDADDLIAQLENLDVVDSAEFDSGTNTLTIVGKNTGASTIIIAADSNASDMDSIHDFDLAADKLSLDVTTILDDSALIEVPGGGSLSVTDGIASVAAGDPELDDVLLALVTQMGDEAAAVAYYDGNNTYVFQGDGVAGLQDSDVVVQLVGVEVTDLGNILG